MTRDQTKTTTTRVIPRSLAFGCRQKWGITLARQGPCKKSMPSANSPHILHQNEAGIYGTLR